MTNWRPKVGALGVLALVAGTAATVAAPAHGDTAADPATGKVIGWAGSAETASYPGPFARLGDNGLGTNAVGAISADGTVSIVAAAQASAQAVPANVSGQRTVSLSVGGPRSIWAASADGSVTKWGGSRGSFPDQSWTPEQLGGKAIAVSGSVYRAYVIVETPEGDRHVTLLAYGADAIDGTDGVHPVVDGSTGDPVTDVVALGVYNRDPGSSYNQNTIALRADGSLVALSVGQGWYELRPAGDDPVVAFGNQPGESGTVVGAIGSFVTQSGRSYGFRLVQPGTTVPWELESWQDDNFPGVPEGQTVKEVDATGDASLGSPQFLLTDQGDVVAWTSEPQAGGGEATPVPLPAAMAAGGVLDIADGAYALVESEAPPPALIATSEPSISGTARAGQSLTGTPAAFNDATATVTHQWRADGTAISGATGVTLALTAALVGRSITFESTATRGSDTLTVASGAYGPVLAAPIVRTYSKPPKFTLTLRPTSRRSGRATVVVARATTARPVPTGTVRVTITKAGSRRTITAKLSAGRRTVILPRLAKGTWRVRVSYLGDRYYLPRNSGLYTLKILR